MADSNSNNTSLTNVDLGGFAYGTTTTFTGFLLGSEVKIESFKFLETEEGNFIEVVKRQAPAPYATIATWPPRQSVDRVWKEIYGILRNDAGKKELRLIKSIEGSITPGHYVEEKVEFPE